MPDSQPQFDPWRGPILLLWTLFFAIGLAPEWCFDYLRYIGKVTTPNALVNSHHLITLALAAYLGLFTYLRSIEANIEPVQAHGKALQVIILALIAFLPVTRIVVQYNNIPVQSLRNVVIGVTLTKMLAWLYLYTVIIRYYFIDQYRVFKKMRSIFPSVIKTQKQEPPQTE